MTATRMPNHRGRTRSTLPYLTIVALTLALSTSCMTPYEKGESFYEAGNYTDAKSEAEHGLKRTPENPRLNLLMAEILVAQESYEKAQTYAETAAQAKSTRGEGARILGKIHWELGRAIETVEAWRTARKVDPSLVSDKDWLRALEAGIDSADSSHQYQKALTLRESLAKLKPDHPEVTDKVMLRTRRKLAEALVDSGNYEEAARLYGLLAETTDGAGEYTYERGRLLLRLKRPDEAQKAFDSYIEHAPAGKRLARLLKVARRAHDRNAPGVAIAYFRQAIAQLDGKASFRRAKLRLTLARLLFETDASAEARDQTQTYLEDMRKLRGKPLGGEVFLTAADTASQAGHNGFAIDTLEKALQEAPPTWSVASRLAQQYAVQARQKEAERVLNTYIDRSNSTADALKHAARWARQRRNYNLAKSFYERLLEVDPDRADVWMELGQLYAELGQIEKMKHALDTFVARHGDSRHDLLDVSAIYIDQKLFEKAEQVLEQVRRSHPESLLVVDRMAELYRKWGQPERIHQAYDKWIEARGSEPSDYQLVGERLLRRRKLRQALPFFRKAAEHGIADAWLQIADIYQNQRRDLDMKRALDQYLKVASERTRALRAALSRYRSSSLTRETTAILEELIQREPSVQSHYERLGEAYLSQGRREAAFELWRRYVDNASDTISGLRTVGRWFQQAGKSAIALEFYRQWLGGEKTDPQLYRLMGEAYMKLAPRRWSRRRGSGPSRADAIKHARRFYRRYLEEAQPGRTELTGFASSMRQAELWSIAADAYTRVVDSSPPNSIVHLHHAESLLHLGRAEQAMREYKEYFRARGKTSEDAKRIADQLFDFRYLKRAEPYLDRLFSSTNGDYVQAAFVKLTEIYQHTGRAERISGLVTDYLNRASNPAKGRQVAVQVLQRRGLYEEAAHQIERIREFQGNVMGFELGANFFRAGMIDRARRAFERHAEQSPYSGAVWLKTANFYENHARPKLAAEAYRQSIEAAPDDFKPREARGRFRLLQGKLETGRADFQAALERASTNRRDDVRKVQVETLREIGHFDRAANIAREALSSASRHRGFLLRTLAEHELKTGDKSRANRIIGRLSSSSVALADVVAMLLEHGYRRSAADLIEEELDAGNFSAAGRAMVNRPDVFTRLGGVEELKRAARPLLKQSGSRSAVRAQLGEFFIRQGHEREGVIFLRSAMEDGRPLFRTVLAQTYAKLGHTGQAMDLFHSHLDSVPSSRRLRSLQAVGSRLYLADQPDLFANLLRNLAHGSKYASQATDMYVELLAGQGNLDDALGTVERLTEKLTTRAGREGARPVLEGDQAVDRMIAGLRGLASAGYRREALRFFDQLPAELEDNPDVRRFGFHLAVLDAGERLERLVKRTNEQLAELDAETARQRRMHYAQVLMANGQFDLASRLVQPALRSGDHRSAETAIRFLMRNAYARGNTSRIEELAKRLRRRMSDDLRARTRIANTLDTLGLDEASLQRRLPVARRAPTAEHVNQALRTARAAGDKEATGELVATYLRVAERPLADLRPTFHRAVTRQAHDLAKKLYAPYQRTRPAKLEVRLQRARLAFRFGRVERGRSILRDYLEEVDYGPAAVQRVLAFLDSNDLWAEQVDMVLPNVDLSRLTARSLQYLGLAWAHLRRPERARTFLDRAVEAAPDPAEMATSLTETLVEADFQALARAYGNRAVEAAPTRPAGYLFRGLARLAAGDLEAAKPDLDKGLHSGINALGSLPLAGRVALESGQPKLAEQYLRKLARTPLSSRLPLEPLPTVLETYRRTKQYEAGVRFLEDNFPSFATGQNVTGSLLTLYMAGLYQHAGMQQRTYSLYREAIERHVVRHSELRPTPGSLNNLAYAYSTTNRHIDQGFDLVRRAIAGTRSRTPSYIDTLGWLQYRRGELPRAEATIRSALRTSTGRGAQLGELFGHLATIRQQRGASGDAYWIRRFSRSLE